VIVVLDTEVFAGISTADLMVFRWLGATGRHRIVVLDTQAPGYTNWLATLEAVRSVATSLYREVGGIYDSFGVFLAPWPSAASIEAAPAEFIRQALRIFRILGKRVVREEQELYPLVDRLDTL
jgi:hypothetical protein